MRSVTLPHGIVEQLLNEARRHAHEEVCGLISARNAIPLRVFPVTNIARDKQQHFEMDPAQLIAAMKHMRNDQESLFAIYHSHIHAPAYPSPTDIARAAYPDTLYLIIAPEHHAGMTLRGFYLHRDRVETVELHIDDQHQPEC